MKTLKQIREEYNSKFAPQVDTLPEELVLEGKTDRTTPAIPSMKDMPSLLIFRRLSFRLYPKNQVVALYYSKLVDKYLSIPFGPGGNLNLSEAVVLDEEQLNEFLPAALAGAGEVLAGAGARAALTSGARAVTGAARTLGRTKIGRLAKNLAKQGLKKILNPSKDDNTNQQSTSQGEKPSGELIRNKPDVKTYSSWETGQGERAIDRVRQKELLRKDSQTSSNRTVNENKISDIRTMIKEGIDNMDLSINGRQVTLNTSMAKRILEVYDSVNTKNKKIVESMLNEDLESFKKLLNFSIRN